MAYSVTVALMAVGVPASLARLWWIWWQSLCGKCGLQHRVCTCGPGDHTMRPRR